MDQPVEPIFRIEGSQPVSGENTFTTQPGGTLSAPASPQPAHVTDPLMGLALPAALVCTGIILTGYEAFRLKSRWRIKPRNPDDDYEFHRFGWALWGPLLLLFGILQALCSWEWIGALGGLLIGSVTVLLMMWRAKVATKQREMIA